MVSNMVRSQCHEFMRVRWLIYCYLFLVLILFLFLFFQYMTLCTFCLSVCLPDQNDHQIRMSATDCGSCVIHIRLCRACGISLTWQQATSGTCMHFTCNLLKHRLNVGGTKSNPKTTNCYQICSWMFVLRRFCRTQFGRRWRRLFLRFRQAEGARNSIYSD